MFRRLRSSCLAGFIISLSCVLSVARPGLAQSGPLAPSQLRCEYLSNPVGIDVKQPRFSWVLEHTERGEKQSAYQVLVATRHELLDRGQGDQWDSGKVASEESGQVVYGGKALVSGHTYYWRVRWWDGEGRASDFSPTAEFGMGLLSPADWKGKWIGGAPDRMVRGGANLLRTEFSLAESVTRARAYICGLGYYELRINGRKVGMNVLDPAFTVYDKRVLYSTYDVTDRLKQGLNAVGVMLGHGWYGTPVLLFQLNVELASGKQVNIESSANWKANNGPITSDSVYDGEVYDARLETPGWDQAGFDDSGWNPAGITNKPPTGSLSAEMMPPIRVVDTLVPVALMNPKPGVYVYDIGQNLTGWAQLRVRGPRGAAVRMRFSELVYPNGMINRENIRAAKARDIYILRGEGMEVYEPRFTYHGFRYIEVTGFPGTPSLDSIRCRFVHSAVRTTGSFVAANPTLNQIQRLIHWGELSNLFSIPTDCPQRNERMGWMGDAQVTTEEAMLNFDMAAFYSNFVRDIRDAQGQDGTVPDTVPLKYGQQNSDPAWGAAYPLICWYMYEQYGDRRVLEESFEGLKKYVEFLRSEAQDNVLRRSLYGDWVPVEPTPGEIVSDFYYYWDVKILARVAALLGKTADAQTYSQLAETIKEAFNRAFLDSARGTYSTGTQTAHVLPLYLDLVPENRRGAVMGHLSNDIVYWHNTHLTTGFIGVKYLLPVLTRYGRSDLAYELATQTTYPSWGYMISRGATTLWELWQERTGPSMNSHNHAMFGSVGAWFYQALGGINVEDDAPGYRRITIAPQVARDLASASATVDTLRGRVSSSWAHSPGVLTLEVTVPVNSVAKVVVPKEDAAGEPVLSEGGHVIWEKGKFAGGVSGVASAADSHTTITLEVGSGSYSFKLVQE